MRSISKKVILTGTFGVGKTSLISRFVYKRFPFNYQTTLGVRIDRKSVDLENVKLNMILWDIGGEKTQSRVPDSYFLGSGGVIYVFDISRPQSYAHIDEDVSYIKNKLPNATILVIGNKADLLDEDKLEEVKSLLPVKPDFFTSAKIGKNVENVFLQLANKMIN